MQFNKLFSLALAVSLPGLAHGEGAPPEQADQVIEEIVVVGHPLSAEGIAQASDVLAGEELDRKVADSIGATVANEPGIHNSSFGVAAGRPVIHGLDGARVRVLEDRIDTLDVSVTSGDHAVTVDPYIADRIEILKGSATLLYGSGA
ncbi:MAG: Plug domain-containing protein, partial [Gammaproteobacteria bacterium]|nr:Plug domain-containing protein [Gammaproteobacteria bacterium]